MQGHLLRHNSSANVRTDHSGTDYHPVAQPDDQPDFDSDRASHCQPDGGPDRRADMSARPGSCWIVR